jgi:mannose-6-phosphate isomerase-like protein (cupin superfamily)
VDQLVAGNRFQVNRITVKPGGVLSLQKHFNRSEHWIVVRGSALVTKADEQLLLKEDSSTYISAGIAHRLENPGKIPLELIEVQTGGYIGEDDITRLEDIYGRHREVRHSEYLFLCALGSAHSSLCACGSDLDSVHPAF